MTEAITRKKKVRAGHRLYVRNIITKVENLVEHLDGKGNVNKLKAHQKTLQDRISILNTLDEEILSDLQDEGDALEREIVEAGEFNGAVHEALANIESALESHMAINTSVSSNAVDLSEITSLSQGGQQASEVSETASCKLPKLTLKPFNGDTSHWLEFWDSFESAVHNNTRISAVDKFNYLRGLLSGAAASTIAGFSLSAPNYDAAVKLLQERFANPQAIIASHMEKLLKIPRVMNASDTKEMRKVYDNIEANIRSLKNLGIESAQYGSLLVPVMLSKLPDEQQLLISRKFDKNLWDFDAFIEAFRGELEARERCVAIGITSQEFPTNRRHYTNRSHAPATAAALMSAENTASCTFCKGPQSSASCGIVTDVSARRRILKNEGRCFICLKKGHLARECSSNIKCFECGRRHHVSVCESRSPTLSKSPQTSTNLHLNTKGNILLQTACCEVCNPNVAGYSLKTRIILDLGSQKSYITHRLSEALKLQKIRSENLLVKTFGSASEQFRVCDVVQVALRGLTDDLNMYVTCHAVPTICAPLDHQPVEFAAAKYPHLTNLTLADTSTAEGVQEIEMLIGADFFWHIASGRVIRGEQGPVAMETRLGYVLSGPAADEASPTSTIVNITSTHILNATAVAFPSEETLKEQLSKFWSLESIGILPMESSVQDQFEETVKFSGERYEVQLPWKEGHAILPDNYDLSAARLGHLLRKLQSDKELFWEYDDLIKKQVTSGVVEEVPSDAGSVTGRVHYIPHHPVVRRDKETSKVRIVYDASAKNLKSGPSLNECLHAGPSLIPKIMDILIRFRYHKVALVGDVEKAFHQVSIKPEDRDVLRFLWIDDAASPEPRMRVYRFTRAVFGVKCSPFLLNASISHHIRQYADDPAFVERFLSSLYVDDFSGGAATTREAYQLFLKSRERMAEGGFNLRKWQSNDEELIALITSYIEQNSVKQASVLEGEVKPSALVEDESTYAKLTCGSTEILEDPKHLKLLGMNWNLTEDEFFLELSHYASFASSLPLTKRAILRMTAKVYDPLGLIAPIVLPMKQIFQKLCIDKEDWDVPLNNEMKGEVMKWIGQLIDVRRIAIPRCYFQPSGEIRAVQLHGFGDASKTAFGAVIFLRIETDVNCYASLVCSKSRVAPLEKQSTPRLELLAGLTLARLLSTVKYALQPTTRIDDVYCWLDSLTAIYGIVQENKEWKPFVQNRVAEIRSLIPTHSWLHCPTEENVADIASRGSSPRELSEETRWWKGPSWLPLPKEEWPSLKTPLKVTDEVMTEMKASEKRNVREVVANLSIASATVDVMKVISCENFSCINRLLRVTALVRRFIVILKEQSDERKTLKALTTEEINEAEEPVVEEVVDAQPVDNRQRPRRQAAVTGELRRRIVDQCYADNDEF